MPKKTLTDQLRGIFGQHLEQAGQALHRAGIHPDTITIAGLGFVFVAALFIANGQMQLAGLILLLGLPLDALDGAVARAMQRTDPFGGLLDSTLDRYADGFIFAALGYHFASLGELDKLVLAMAALMGSYGVSYARARAGEAGISVKDGLFTRLERVITLLVMLFVPPLLLPGLWLLAVGTNLTMLQRLWTVFRSMNRGS
jgi:CDP-diacylglycerol--glycerol-3-phosphate 3-phosphatidyltransferase